MQNEQATLPVTAPCVVFQNDGLVDMEAVKIMGISSKECDNPIGYFGTGLKYAIAILLRNSQKVTLYRGHKRYVFGVREARVRVDNFNIVTMNGIDLGFTTDLGKRWEMWHAFRELYCNILDEPEGSCSLQPIGAIDSMIDDDKTVIVAQGNKITETYHDRDKYFIHDEPLYKESGVWIHKKKSTDPEDKTLVFLKGILVYTFGSPSSYRYNITGKMELTEDRTLKYSFIAASRIWQALIKSKDSEFISSMVVIVRQGAIETALMSDNDAASDLGGVSEEFIKTVGELLEGGMTVHKGASGLHERYLRKTTTPKEYCLTSIQRLQLGKAVKLCKTLGLQSIDDYKIKTVETLGPEVLGRADFPHKTILISSKAFNMGTKVVAGTLIEEYIHLKHGVYDHSREMQNILLDLLVTSVETNQLKEPL